MRALAVGLTLALLPLNVSAQADLSPQAVAVVDEQTFVDLEVNGQSKGDVLAIARGDVLIGVDAAALQTAGVPVVTIPGFYKNGRRFVDPALLGPRISARYEASQLILFIAVRSIDVQRVDLSQNEQVMPDFAHPSATLGYNLTGVGSLEHQLSLAAALTAGPNQLTASGMLGNVSSRPTFGFEHDDPAHRTNYEVGTFESTSVDDMPAIPMAGFQLRRDFTLAPLQPSYPMPVYSGIADEPSVADIYVGGVLERSIPIAPGPFALQGIGDSSGAGVRIVLRDAQGTVRTYYGSPFANISLLAAGTNYDSLDIGQDVFSGRPVIDTAYRLGITNQWTAGVHLRSEFGPLNAEVSSDVDLGQLQFHLAGLQAGGQTGYVTSTSLVGKLGRLGFGYSAQPAQTALDNVWRMERELALSASRNIGRCVDLTAQLIRQSDNGSSSESIVASANVMLHNGMSAALSFERDVALGSRSSNRIGLQFSTSAVRRGNPKVSDSMNVSVSPQGGSTLDLRSAPTGATGATSEIRLGDQFSELSYGYSSSSATAVAALTHDPFGYSASYEVQGALGMVGGVVKAAQSLDDSFALVEVPGLSNTPVYLDGRNVGNTDAKGKLLVGGLTAYQPATIEIHPEDLSLDVEVDRTSATVVAPRHGGSVVRFPTQFVSLVQGRIFNSNGKPLAPFATVKFAQREQNVTAQLDEFDAFTVDHLSPGEWSFVVADSAFSRCGGSFTVEAGHKPMVDLGKLQCENLLTKR